MLALAVGETDWQSSGEGLAKEEIGKGIFNNSISVCFPQTALKYRAVPSERTGL